MNLIENIQLELTRARTVLGYYNEIPQGAFGAIMIKREIAAAEKAIAEQDVAAMIISLASLKNIE